MKNDSHITEHIDDLARMVADGFRSMESRIDSVEASLTSEIRSITQRIDTVVLPTIDDHSRRIKDLEMA